MSAGKKSLDFLGRGVPEIARSALINNKAWIGGQWVSSIRDTTYPVVNPASLELITEVHDPLEYDHVLWLDHDVTRNNHHNILIR